MKNRALGLFLRISVVPFLLLSINLAITSQTAYSQIAFVSVFSTLKEKGCEGATTVVGYHSKVSIDPKPDLTVLGKGAKAEAEQKFRATANAKYMVSSKRLPFLAIYIAKYAGRTNKRCIQTSYPYGFGNTQEEAENEAKRYANLWLSDIQDLTPLEIVKFPKTQSK